MELHISDGEQITKEVIECSNISILDKDQVFSIIQEINTSLQAMEPSRYILNMIREKIAKLVNSNTSLILSYEDCDYPMMRMISVDNISWDDDIETMIQEDVIFKNFNNLHGYSIVNNCIYISNNMKKNESIPMGHIIIEKLLTIPLTYRTKIIGCLYIANTEITRDIVSELLNIIPSLSILVNEIMTSGKAEKEEISKIILNMEHSFKTPLTSIAGSVEMLKMMQNTTQIKNITDIIETSYINLTQVLDDVILASKLATNTLTLKPENFSITDMIRHVNQENLEINNKLLYDIFRADTKYIYFILHNLISNSTENIIINLWCDAIKINDCDNDILEYNNVKLNISVEYTSTQEDSLSLSICRGLSRLMGGDIKVKSPIYDNGGTRFTISISVDITPNIEQILDKYGDLIRKKPVLILDTNIDTRMSIYNIYHEWNIPVYMCSNLRELDEFLKSHQACLCLASSTYSQRTMELEGIFEINNSCIELYILTNVQDNETNSLLLKGSKVDKYDLLITTVKSSLMSKSLSSHSSPSCRSVKSKDEIDILLVEDDSDNRILTKQMLKVLGYKHVTTSQTGSDAIEKLLKKQYDIVFMDNRMPHMTGVEVVLALYELMRTDLDNIVILTAGISNFDIDQLNKVGVTNIMMKPYTLDDLKKIIANIILGVI